MLRSTFALLSLCSLGFAQGPVFQPKPGSTWTRAHDQVIDLKFDRISMTVDGTASESAEYEIQMVSTNHMLVEDTVFEWQSDGERHLERAFLEVTRDRVAPIKMSAMGQTVSRETKVHGESPLQGQRVDFRSSAAGKSWLPTFSEGEDENLPPEWLGGLQVDLDYSILLPSKRTLAGGRWSVDPRAFLSALDAGGQMPFDFGAGQGTDLPSWIGGVADQPGLASLWDGFENSTVRCKMMPQKKSGHLRLLEIQVTATFNGDADLSDWAMDTMAGQGSASAEISVEQASQNTVLTGSGVYLWDLDKRTMHSFYFKADGRFVREQELTVLTGDEEMHIAVQAEGHFDLDVSAITER